MEKKVNIIHVRNIILLNLRKPKRKKKNKKHFHVLPEKLHSSSKNNGNNNTTKRAGKFKSRQKKLAEKNLKKIKILENERKLVV